MLAQLKQIGTNTFLHFSSNISLHIPLIKPGSGDVGLSCTNAAIYDYLTTCPDLLVQVWHAVAQLK